MIGMLEEGQCFALLETNVVQVDQTEVGCMSKEIYMTFPHDGSDTPSLENIMVRIVALLVVSNGCRKDS